MMDVTMMDVTMGPTPAETINERAADCKEDIGP